MKRQRVTVVMTVAFVEGSKGTGTSEKSTVQLDREEKCGEGTTAAAEAAAADDAKRERKGGGPKSYLAAGTGDS